MQAIFSLFTKFFQSCGGFFHLADQLADQRGKQFSERPKKNLDQPPDNPLNQMDDRRGRAEDQRPDGEVIQRKPEQFPNEHIAAYDPIGRQVVELKRRRRNNEKKEEVLKKNQNPARWDCNAENAKDVIADTERRPEQHRPQENPRRGRHNHIHGQAPYLKSLERRFPAERFSCSL